MLNPYEEHLTRATFEPLVGRPFTVDEVDELIQIIQVTAEVVWSKPSLMRAFGIKPPSIDRSELKAYPATRKRGSMPVATHKGSGQVGEITFTIQVFKEGKFLVAHAPELDVSSQGESVEAAKAHLREAVEAFLEEAQRMGTLTDLLEEAGYQRTPEGWKAPDLLAQERAKVTLPR